MTLETDPLWYKDAIIYELHVRAFYDANNDGDGDFQGLIRKLDYIEKLGVNCIWLLPFYPSPLKDDGYDISNFWDVHPIYGSLRDFKQFIREAHRRDIRVITELVINHTSDQHPWFQAARHSQSNSAKRNYYIWSDTDDKFPESRIIFSDLERSNWAWDETAKAYYWHRFFSHQPDLNHNNPKVVQAVIKVLHYWLEMGVDGLRLDAVPYLCVREGTNNENLPETHEVIKQMRKAVDAHYHDRMLLAEANQWPELVCKYFGQGDECHMAFHFPLMPRIFLAIRKENRLPITDIISKTPHIPNNCQWGLFLRNHDELTLEMVTDEERDYMYKEYVTDPRMRLNLGIRRRLAPLVDNDMLTIQMLNSLLLSFPGTPFIYYGDEIGMGDNIYLGDRNGVRTPMQWSIDRNAGFSRADPAKLFNPVIMDPVYGYQAVNVEAQDQDPSSLLNFMRRILAMRRQYKAFGRGTMEFLYPKNKKILAYIRRYKQEVILCVVNLSKNVQPVELDLSSFKDRIPWEIFGRTDFPLIAETPYFLSIGPHSFYWFQLEQPSTPIYMAPVKGEREIPLPVIQLEDDWEELWDDDQRKVLAENILPSYLPRQHWYVKTYQSIASIKIMDIAKLGGNFYFLFIRIHYSETQETDLVCLPVRISTGLTAQTVAREMPEYTLAWLKLPTTQGVLHDALFDESACQRLLAMIEENRTSSTLKKAKLYGVSYLSPETATQYEKEILRVTQITPRAKNTSIFYTDRLVLKLYRYVEEAPNPDIEMRRFLYECGRFTHIPKIYGEIQCDGLQMDTIRLKKSFLALLQEYIPNEGDALTFTKILLKQYLCHSNHDNIIENQTEGKSDTLSPEVRYINIRTFQIPIEIKNALGPYEAFYTFLGKRIAELHIALQSERKNKEFRPEPLTQKYLTTTSQQMKANLERCLSDLLQNQTSFSESVQNNIQSIGAASSDLNRYFENFAKLAVTNVELIRCHGDLHLTDILKTGNDFVFLDFEGNMMLPLSERRQKRCALTDIAQVMISLQQACLGVLIEQFQDDIAKNETRILGWQYWINALLLKSYLDNITKTSLVPKEEVVLEKLLLAFMFNLMFFELDHALSQNDDSVAAWVWGISSLLPWLSCYED